MEPNKNLPKNVIFLIFERLHITLNYLGNAELNFLFVFFLMFFSLTLIG